MFYWAKEFVATVAVFAVMVVIGVGLISLVRNGPGAVHRVVTYDCRIAEISPDVPTAVKEKCRRLKP